MNLLDNSEGREEGIPKVKDAVKEICSLLEKKLALFKQYLSITEQLKESIGNKEDGDLGALLSERQGCIKEIEGIDLSMEKVVKANFDRVCQISDQVNTHTQTHPLACDELSRVEGGGEDGGEGLIDSYLMKIKRIMEAIDPIDGELVVMVKEEGERIKREILKMRDVQRVARGYRRAKGVFPRFLNTVR